jgi:hypothetical protein
MPMNMLTTAASATRTSISTRLYAPVRVNMSRGSLSWHADVRRLRYYSR